ncbi:MAG TPA: ABC transporter permease [Actinomycetota bacterium]|nr:ABC transporter permease [Actinomycetota bacterium]
MSDAALALRQVTYENRSFWRNPASAFFTFVFPIMFMVIFNLIFGSSKYSPFGPGGRVSDFYTPALMAFSIITACYTNIAMGVVFAREEGILKRLRGTPLPRWVWLFARIVVSILVAVLLVVIIGAFGRIFYHVDLPGARTLPALVVALVVGAATFCAIGLAMTSFVPNVDAAPAVVNATIFPLLFISDVFIPIQHKGVLTTIASIFPVKHLSHAVIIAYNPLTRGSGFDWKDLAIMAAWGVFAVGIALRGFRWEPKEQG